MRLGVKLSRLPMLFLTQMHAPHSHWARTQPQLKYSPRFLMKVPVFMAKNPDSFFNPFPASRSTLWSFHNRVGRAHISLSPCFFRRAGPGALLSIIWQPWASHLVALAAACLCYLPGHCDDRTQGRVLPGGYKAHTEGTRCTRNFIPCCFPNLEGYCSLC